MPVIFDELCDMQNGLVFADLILCSAIMTEGNQVLNNSQGHQE